MGFKPRRHADFSGCTAGMEYALVRGGGCMLFHRCVIAVIGVLAVSTSAAAGPIRLGESGPSLNIDELRASGARMDDKELRAVFFRGAGSRNASASCAECLVAQSSLHARDRGTSMDDAFPFSAASL